MLFQALIMAAALSEPAPPPSAPPFPPSPGFVLNGVQEMTLSFDEKGKKREIVIRMHGGDAPADVLVDGKAVKDVELRFSADRVSLLPRGPSFTWAHDGSGNGAIRLHVERALELAEKDRDSAGKPKVEIFRFDSREGQGEGPERSCVDSGNEIVCTIKKPGLPGLTAAPQAPAAPKPPEAPK